jgi:hypothetical protein
MRMDTNTDPQKNIRLDPKINGWRGPRAQKKPTQIPSMNLPLLRSLALLSLNLVLCFTGESILKQGAKGDADAGSNDSVLIGLTLAVNENFKILFIVIIFHRKTFFFSPV